MADLALDPLAGCTATCFNCDRKLVRGGLAKIGYHWQHVTGMVGCSIGHGKKAMAAADTIVCPSGVYECRGCGWSGNDRSTHPSWCPDPSVEPTIAQPVHPDQEQLAS